MEYKKLKNIQLDGIDMNDYPKFCDAYVTSGSYNNEPLTEEQCTELTEDGEFMFEKIQERLINESIRFSKT